MNNRTKIVEFLGLPKTGKTTTVNALNKFLSKQNIKSRVVVERASLCPVRNKLNPAFNMWTTFSLMKEFVETSDNEYDILIADRGIIDAYIWINLLCKRNNDYSVLQEFEELLKLKFFENKILRAYYFTAEIEVIFNREFERLIEPKYGIIMNKDILDEYTNTYANLKGKLIKLFPIKEVNTSNKTIQEVLKDISKDINVSMQAIIPN